MNIQNTFHCYNYNDDFLLIEMLINDIPSNINFMEFVVPDKKLKKTDWQCPYLEQYLNIDGTKRICDLFDSPEKQISPTHITFFIYKTKSKILKTPYGSFQLEITDQLPDRLKDIIEFVEID